MSSALTTSLALLYDGPFVAEVIGADATATTYVLNCPPGTDSTECGTYNNTVTLGPWASETLPPGAASTGVFDQFITMPYEEPWRFSLHCEMSRTVAQRCTTINIGGNDDGTPTRTLSTPDELEYIDMETLVYAPVTVTAGQELLTAGPSPQATVTGDATGDEADDANPTQTSTSTATPEENLSSASSSGRTLAVVVAAGLIITAIFS